MIVRSGAALDKLFDTVAASKILGPCDEEALALFRQMDPNAEIPEGRENDREGTLRPNGQVAPSQNLFGFWLPHGLITEEETRFPQISSCLSRFKAIEQAYFEAEGIPESAPVVAGEPEE